MKIGLPKPLLYASLFFTFSANAIAANIDDSGCWWPTTVFEKECVSGSAKWSKNSEGKLILTIKNNCSLGVFVKACFGRKDRSKDMCYASHVSSGRKYTFDDYRANGDWSFKWVGVDNPNKDWVCAHKVDDWS